MIFLEFPKISIFEELEALYCEINDKYAREEFDARARVDSDEEIKLARKRELNDHAYFLFLFTRLEDHIREQSSKLISDKQNNMMDWKDRRAWDILPKEKGSDNITFLNRVALLVDKGSHHYQKIKGYYELRNKLGHGGNFSSPVLIQSVVSDFDSFQNLLNP